ncbi:hypothetical protein [uncultured Amnibacterium sp.]|uniref:hypothetical protein n=1 Tax=uncultured Amnibacterium sp. TaxID=1631851 RepID=UPI0035CB1FF6
MSVIASAVLAATTIEEGPLIAPSVVFPIIAISVFLLLGFVAFSYRDVAHRQDARPGGGSSQGH